MRTTRLFFLVAVTSFTHSFACATFVRMGLQTDISSTNIVLASLAAYLLPIIVLAPLVGWVMIRFRPLTIVHDCLFGELLLLVLAFLQAGRTSPSIGFLFVAGAVILLGLGASLVSTALLAVFPELFGARQLPFAVGISQAGVALGFMSGVTLVVGSPTFGDPGWPISVTPTLIVVLVVHAVVVPRLRRIPSGPPGEHRRHGPLSWTAETCDALRQGDKLIPAVVAVGCVTATATVYLLNAWEYSSAYFPVYPRTATLGLFISFAIGVTVASVIVGRSSRGVIEIGLFPLAAGACALVSIVLLLTGIFGSASVVDAAGRELIGEANQPIRVERAAPASLLFALAGFFVGTKLSLLYAWVTHNSRSEHRSSCLAVTNACAAAGVVVGWMWRYVFHDLIGLSPKLVFLTLAPVLVGLAWIGIRVAPDYFVRITVTLLTRAAYRIRLVGFENVPADGPALLVANHLSYADGNLIVATFPRFVRFVVYEAHYHLPFLNLLGRTMRAIPVEATGPPRQIVRALHQAAQELKRGELLFVFPEGGLSRIGILQPFHRGFELIMKHAPGVPIIPLYIDGMWGSIFSYQGGKFFWKWPKRWRYPVTIKFGRPMPSNATTTQVREAIQLLSAECLDLRKADHQPLPTMFVRRAKRFSRRACISDGTTPMMTFGQTLMRTIILSRLLRRKLADTRFVGIFLPPSVGAVLANLSVSGLGRIPVNLNYTVGLEVLDNCITQCGIRQVITSRQFTEKIKLEPHAELVFLEDLRSQVGTSDKFSGLVGRFLPAGLVTRLFFDVRQIAMDELATVIFSSGSTGIPKGVMLTHHNIISNIESVVQTVDCTERDRVMGVLPLFHSFGYTVSMWLPLRIGASAVYHYSPLEAEVIGKMVREQQATIFLSTATFLRNYIRKCGADDFRSVRIIMCGAEKLPMQVADQFERKFGIRPLEGYGCTELSPAVSANRPDVERRGGRQVGHKPGTIGHPMPGIAVRIAHPETLEPLPIGQEGLLLVKGPNVMKGYLNRPDLTAEAIRDGWYCTGDIARLDEDGFLTITDRISRFSKIGGEMVPHAKIENEIHRILDTHEQLCVVVGVPDERKGERLVVIHVPLPISVDELWHKLSQSGLPPLWIPSRSAFFEVSNLLVLGSGKLDLKGIKAIAHQKLAG